MSSRLLYFAYGSNLLPERLRERVASARVVGTGRISGRVLRFHKLGGDGSGKCDCHATGDPRDRVCGVVYEMDEFEKPGLDAAEGPGYAEIEVAVRLSSSSVTAYTYAARDTHVVPGIPPFHWYKALVLMGARHHRLDKVTLRRIRAVVAVPDTDPERAARHRGLITDHTSPSDSEIIPILDDRPRSDR
ncbi:MAG: gamma-glutamylcyclotransferase family protein [Pseudomonadota bacterium]|nr:gamma-glutamylcyclotransferase family protein [Pseudomonadota bacterium]